MTNLTFRAWDDLNKKWFMDSPRGFSLTGECVLFGEWGHFFDEFLFCKNGKEPQHLIIEQSTGRLVNGVEMFVGDKVLVKGKKSVGEYETTVVFKDYCFCLEDNRTYLVDNKSLVAVKAVTGNIHEEPEL